MGREQPHVHMVLTADVGVGVGSPASHTWWLAAGPPPLNTASTAIPLLAPRALENVCSQFLSTFIPATLLKEASPSGH